MPANGDPVVLVVDDDLVVRDLVARMLTEAGYAVLTAGNGEEALAMAGTLAGRLGLLVTDIRMPLMEGPELAVHLIALTPRLPVLFISGFAPPGDATTLPGPVLAKPFSPDALLAHVGRLVPPRQLTRSVQGADSG